ncbi:hypothetical protein [Blastococcus saxobsidens]|uniref:CHRD domain-containing protein n=1 Tax=Blastococcus saxobsidens (strain DD2) TaxID=1146883 RepID=H6RN89_BLASD|nr:hypothetical protein [Blastococcus saxobsidens]CCG02637.1 conserved exported protein of unknown function [Blastococcus saxobsidens DD2]
MRKTLAMPAVAIAAAAFPLLTMSAASAADGSYQAELGALNDSGATGMGMVTFQGDQATVTVEASGLLAGAPHAQHFHIGAEGVCPPASADENGDGIISTVEGQPFYGSIGTSLTTTGDTSADSALAVERFPTAEGGSFTYERTFTVDPSVVDSFEAGTAVLVVHGIDPDNSGAYDGEAMSELNPELPLEATAPAACGAFTASQMGQMPTGGAETGAGSTAGIEHEAAMGVGAVAVAGAAAAGAVAYRRRQAADQA